MFLFFLLIFSAFGLFRFLPKSIPLGLKLLISLALGLILFTQLTLFSSFIFGLNLLSILIGLFTVVLTSSFFIFNNKDKLKGLKSRLKVSKVFVVILVITVSICGWFWFTQALAPSAEGLKTGGGGMYGDTALHAAYTSRLTTGEFPAQNPLFAGKVLVYPFANDLLSASLRLSGASINSAFVFPQLIFLVAFIALFYHLAKLVGRETNFVISIFLFLFGWGFGFFYFLRDSGFLNLGFWQSLNLDYTDSDKYNLFFHNILTGLILPERSFLPGLVLGLLLISWFWDYTKDRNIRSIIAAAIVLGILPFWHTHTFIFCSVAIILFSIYFFYKGRNLKIVKDFSLLFFTSLFLALPFIVLFLQNHQASDFLRTSFGWQQTSDNIILFWFKNSLLIIPLAMLGYSGLDKRFRILFWPSFLVFLIGNFVIFQPWSWDNIKLLSWSFLFFCLLASFYLDKLLSANAVAKIFALLLIVVSCLSGILSLLLQAKNTYVAYSNADIDLANWATKATKTSSVFVIDPWPNHPIPGLAGRLVYIGYPGHLWVHGIDYSKREAENNLILSGDISQINHLEVPISYVVVEASKDYLKDGPLAEVFRNEKYKVYTKL